MKEIKAVIKDKGKRIKVKGDKGEKKSKKRNTLYATPACRQAGITKRGRRMKFRPEITRVKLNPEQAVLSCSCYDSGVDYTTKVWSTNWDTSGVVACSRDGLGGKKYAYAGVIDLGGDGGMPSVEASPQENVSS